LIIRWMMTLLRESASSDSSFVLSIHPSSDLDPWYSTGYWLATDR
jgi:hypothetical protein